MEKILLILLLCGCGLNIDKIIKVESNNTELSKWNLGNSPFPLNMQISTDFTSAESTIIKNAANSWADTINSDINFFTNDQNTNPLDNNFESYNDNVIGIYKIYEWPESASQTSLAVAQVFGRRVNIGTKYEYIEIVHADILINYDPKFGYYNSGNYDLESIVLHEMGHVLGLPHFGENETDSVMYPTIHQNQFKRTPTLNDTNNLKILYSL